jgi:hypothetical protein
LDGNMLCYDDSDKFLERTSRCHTSFSTIYTTRPRHIRVSERSFLVVQQARCDAKHIEWE